MDSEAKAIAAYEEGEQAAARAWARTLTAMPPLEIRLRAAQYKDPVVLSPRFVATGELHWERLESSHLDSGGASEWNVYAIRENPNGQ